MFFWNGINKLKSCIWNDIDIKLSFENNFNGNEYYLKPCMYLLISLEYIPNVHNPGNNVNKLNINELALDDECAKTTTLFWYKIAFQI